MQKLSKVAQNELYTMIYKIYVIGWLSVEIEVESMPKCAFSKLVVFLSQDRSHYWVLENTFL